MLLGQLSVEHSRYILKHTLISMLISTAICVFFVWLIFSGREQIPLLGSSGAAIDFLPQTFMISFMAALMPSLGARSDLKKGLVSTLQKAGWRGPKHPALRALLLAFSFTLCGSALATGGLYLLGADSFTQAQIWSLKLIYSAVIAFAVTPMALKATLRQTD